MSLMILGFRLGFGSFFPKKNVLFLSDSRFLADNVFDNLFQRFGDGLKCLSNAMSSSILPAFKARYFLLIESLGILSRSLIFSSMLITLMYHQQLTMLRYRKVIKSFLNPFLYCPSMSALSLSITRNPYFCRQQLRHNSQKSS